MTRFFTTALTIAAILLGGTFWATAQETPKPYPIPQLKRGAKPTPRAKIFRAPQHRVHGATPAQFGGPLPPQLSMWGNSTYGDCVSAEEAAAKAFYSVSYCGLQETFITENTVVAWANQHGYLNGATLTDPMDTMIKVGMTASDGKTYLDGPYSSVDYSTESILQNAIATGPVKIGIDANALPSTAGSNSGWYATGGAPGQYTNEDHCVGIYGYGPPQFLFGLMGSAVPAGFSNTKTYYMLYTWSTVGVVDHDWIMSTCGEAWVRNPTTPGQSPTPAPTPPTPIPNPPNPTPVPPTPAPAVWPIYDFTFAGTVGPFHVNVTATATPRSPK